MLSLSVHKTNMTTLEAGGDGEEKHCETTHDSLSSHNMNDTGVHLTQLITESIKASIHAHKLCHDGLKCHSTRG